MQFEMSGKLVEHRDSLSNLYILLEIRIITLSLSKLGEAMYEPIELLQPKNGCLSCVVANTIFMFTGKMPDIRYIDRKIGRSPGGLGDTDQATLFLVESGFKAEVIENWHAERFVKEGIAYLKEISGSDWKKSPCYKWTDTKTAKAQRETEKEIKREKPLRSRLKRIYRHPKFDDIIRLAKQDKAVHVAVNSGYDSVNHSILVYDLQGSNLQLYNPLVSGKTLQVWSKSKLKSHWVQKMQLAAFWK